MYFSLTKIRRVIKAVVSSMRGLVQIITIPFYLFENYCKYLYRGEVSEAVKYAFNVKKLAQSSEANLLEAGTERLNYQYLWSERNRIWANADHAYQQANWVHARNQILLAQDLQDKINIDFGIDPKHIKFIGSNITNSIGHIAIALGLRVRLEQIEATGNKYIILSENSANDFYLSLWERYFPIIKVSSPELGILEKNLWSFFENVQSVRARSGAIDLISAHGTYTKLAHDRNLSPLLTIPIETQIKGMNELKSWGWSSSDWFVTLHIRENLDQRSGYGRNSLPKNYIRAIKKVVENGGKVVRLGSYGSTPLPSIDGLVDLTKHKSRIFWLDTYLLANCRFHIGTSSGPLIVPLTFGRPILATNAPDIGKFVYLPNALVIPKLVKNIEGRTLRFSEQLASIAATSDSYIDEFAGSKLQWIENTAEEIEIATIEMLNRNYLSLTSAQNKVGQMLKSFGFNSETPIANSFIMSNQKIIE